MSAAKGTAAFVILAAWAMWDLLVVCFRTFILGESCEQQMRRIEEDDL